MIDGFEHVVREKLCRLLPGRCTSCSESKKELSPRIAERERRRNASESGREVAEREEDGRSEAAYIGDGVKE